MKQILSDRELAVLNSSSILISILYLVGLIDWSCNSVNKHHHCKGRPYVYSSSIILRCFIVRIWFRLDSNRSLHNYLSIDSPYNKKIVRACGLSELYLPSRRTFDRRLKTISTDINERITNMGNLFVSDNIVNPYTLGIDRTLLKSRGKVWHKSSMNQGIIHCSGIDTDARLGYSHTKKVWIFGYKLHMVSSTGSVVVPLSADVTTAHVQDNQVYRGSTSCLPLETIKKTHYMVADPGYDDDQHLYDKHVYGISACLSS